MVARGAHTPTTAAGLIDQTPRPAGYPVTALAAIRARFAARRDLLPNRLEDVEHRATVSMWRNLELAAGPCLIHHSANEEPSAARRRRAAALGTSSGFPDLVCLRFFDLPVEVKTEGWDATGEGWTIRYVGLAIELKRVSWTWRGVERLERCAARAVARGKRDRTAEKELRQYRWLCALREQGWLAEFARGEGEATDLFTLAYGGR